MAQIQSFQRLQLCHAAAVYDADLVVMSEEEKHGKVRAVFLAFTALPIGFTTLWFASTLTRAELLF